MTDDTAGWRDAASWTSYPPPPALIRPAAVDVNEELRLGRWARLALIAAVVSQVLADVVMRSELRAFIDDVIRNDTAEFAMGGSRWASVVLETASGIGVVTGVLFLVWFVRAARNAEILGLSAKRSPAAGVAGFMVPIINLWWPYQSTRDLLPQGHPRRPLVLRWFLLWMVGGFVGAGVVFAAAFVDSWIGWAMLAVPAVLVILAGVAARSVITDVHEAHASLAAARAA